MSKTFRKSVLKTGVMPVGYLSLVLNTLSGAKFYEGVLGGILLFISVIILLFGIIYPKNYSSIFIDLSQHQDYLNKTEAELLPQLISNTKLANEKNEKILLNKVRWYKIAVFLLLLSSCLFILSKITKFYV